MHRPSLLLIAAAWALSAQAQEPAIFQGADLRLGAQLLAEHKCAACHQQKVGGDGSAIYRPNGRINSAGLLRGMVEHCNTELNLGLFPEEVTALAAVLNRDHYRFAR
ncbi:MAG: hypothetical protein O9318_08565 [Hylemonella sp.]|uniref:hypothetical protein n=1 Tax=Hylemonella sp. TaxID=2066020 RepID=UPI0022C01161|nr:hypothetical protein [Hylemonella sp.]MCZ8252506.1 hypothetical protein [Hylemonella sp.]